MHVRFIAILLVLAGVMVFGVMPAYAGTINVTDFGDTGVGCTLREAITQANLGSDGLGCTGVTASPNTIVLPAGDYTLTSELPEVTSTIVIEESGDDAIIQANAVANVATYRIVAVDSSGNLTLSGLTVRNGGSASFTNQGGCIYVSGVLTVENSIIEDCHTAGYGGAIDGGNPWTLTITNSTLRNNSSNAGGGAIDGSGATMVITNSLFSDNNVSTTVVSGGFGGAISAGGPSSLTVSGSTFRNNSATHSGNGGAGGAIFIDASGTHTISNTRFEGNSVTSPTNARGGAIDVSGSTVIVEISDSVFFDNHANTSGRGGAINTFNGPIMRIATSRFESNTAANGNGGAIHNISGSVTLSQSCITNNGSPAVFDSVFASGDIDATGGGNIADSNWWGTAWGPRIAAAGGGSAVSNGDAINGNGDTQVGGILVDVNLSNPGTESVAPTGNWLTSAPANVAGDNCMECSQVSSTGHGRTCTRP